MNQQQAFDISINRAEKSQVPLLVVGLGGTGRDTVRTIKETFAERYILPKDKRGKDLPAPDRTAYLAIDVLYNKPDGFEEIEYEMLKAICFLADAPGDEPAKVDLTRMMKAEKLRFTDDMNARRMTADRVNEKIAVIDQLLKILQMDREELEHQVHLNPGLKDELDRPVRMLQEVIHVLEQRKRFYGKVAKSLD